MAGGSRSRSGRGGRRFKSCHSDQLSRSLIGLRGTIWGTKPCFRSQDNLRCLITARQRPVLVRATSRTTSTSREPASAHDARWPMQGCASHLPDTLSRAFALYAYGYACAPDRLKIGSTEGDNGGSHRRAVGTGTPDKPVHAKDLANPALKHIPKLAGCQSIEGIRTYLTGSLRFNSEATRRSRRDCHSEKGGP